MEINFYAYSIRNAMFCFFTLARCRYEIRQLLLRCSTFCIHAVVLHFVRNDGGFWFWLSPPLWTHRGANDLWGGHTKCEFIGAALSFVSFFVAVDKESDSPWIDYPLPQMQNTKNQKKDPAHPFGMTEKIKDNKKAGKNRLFRKLKKD